jgi:hypothetical protein
MVIDGQSTVIVTVPGEALIELGWQIRNDTLRLGFPRTFIFGYSTPLSFELASRMSCRIAEVIAHAIKRSSGFSVVSTIEFGGLLGNRVKNIPPENRDQSEQKKKTPDQNFVSSGKKTIGRTLLNRRGSTLRRVIPYCSAYHRSTCTGNNHMGYFATPNEYNVGGYESALTFWGIETAERIRNCTVDIVRQLLELRSAHRDNM